MPKKWLVAHFAKAAPHVNSTFLLGLILSSFLLLLNNLPLCSCRVTFLLEVQVQDLHRLFNGSVCSQVWVKRNISLNAKKFQGIIRRPEDHYPSLDPWDWRASCRERGREMPICDASAAPLNRYLISPLLPQITSSWCSGESELASRLEIAIHGGFQKMPIRMGLI